MAGTHGVQVDEAQTSQVRPVVHEIRRGTRPQAGGVIPDQEQMGRRAQQVGPQAGQAVDDLVVEAEQPVVAEIGFLGGVGDAGDQLEGLAEAALPARAGGGDALADEVLGGEGQHQMDLGVPLQQGLDEQQLSARAGGAVADLRPQFVEVRLEGVPHRLLAVGGEDGLGSPR